MLFQLALNNSDAGLLGWHTERIMMFRCEDEPEFLNEGAVL